MNILVMPITNGVFPAPYREPITGMFVLEYDKRILRKIGLKRDILLCSAYFNPDFQVYPVGIVTRINDLWEKEIFDEELRIQKALMVSFEGRAFARWHTLKKGNAYLYSDKIEILNFRKTRAEYPVISGAGWQATGGYTEIEDEQNIRVTIYGKSLPAGEDVSITAKLGLLVKKEQAHTIEHSIIRALNTYAFCTPRTLIESMGKETKELKQSVEFSMKYAMPEVLGITQSGVCGNPMTSMAQRYLTEGFYDNLKSGKSLDESLIKARKSTMSQLTSNMDITTKKELRGLQGLKRGMAHDDTFLKVQTYKKIISKFPFSPWE